MKKRAVFFDRDGVVNEAIWREGKATGPREYHEWQWIDGIHQAVQQAKAAGFLVFVITNQPDVHRNILPRAMLETFHQKIRDELAIDDIAACLHDDAHDCDCRKPKPGMLTQLAKQWDISLENSFIIGDTIRDMQAGNAAHCTTILLDKPYNQDLKCDFRAKDLGEAVGHILLTLEDAR